MRPDFSVRNDRVDLPLGDEAYVQVYWKQLKFGKGPACSLFILGEEILRIDCFGNGAGHFHAAFFLPGKGENRFWMRESTVAEQVERAHFELYRNYRYYQCRVPNPEVRAYHIEPELMKEVSQQAFEIMSSYVDVTDQLDDEAVAAFSSEIN